MPFLVPSEERIDYLIRNYETGFDEAMITEKSNFFYYSTELEEIGPMYLMDEFGEGVPVEMDMLKQRFFIYPPLAALT